MRMSAAGNKFRQSLLSLFPKEDGPVDELIYNFHKSRHCLCFYRGHVCPLEN
jgi:hypothetical protein